MGKRNFVTMLRRTIFFTLLLASSCFSLPHTKGDEEDRGFFMDIIGGIVSPTTTTNPSPAAETTTMATLYGDLINLFNLIFAPQTTTTTASTETTTVTTTTTTTTSTTTTTTTTTTTPSTTTTKCGGIIGFGLVC